MAKVLFIIANNWFQDNEFGVPYKVLTAQGHVCDIVSWKWWMCYWVFWKVVEQSLKLAEVQWNVYDLLVFVWWGGAYNQYYKDETYLNLWKNGKAVAAICIAPSILSDSWIYQGKEVTWRDDWIGTQIQYMENNGAIFKDEEVVQDGNYITANGPDAAAKFAWTLVDFLAGK